MNDWNPDRYLKFKNERTQPSIDLVSRIDFADPKTIIDFGCGPGNSTQVLVNRWPKARIIGLDNSPAMIAKARKDYPEQEWVLADAASYEPDVKVDIVFSNAAIQWIPNHKKLINKFYNLLSDNGIVAVQMPQFWDMPVGKIIKKVSKDSRWISQTEKASKLIRIHDYSFYYNRLYVLFKKVEIWETYYMHTLDSQMSIIDMIISTGMKPYLEKLDSDEAKREFIDEVLKGIQKFYSLQKDGKVIFPFKRLFFISRK
jgi:trans-aconitate 2-methyltransferase